MSINEQTNKPNDFTPLWFKLPPTRERRPQTLQRLHNNNANTFQSRKADSVLQKDDFPCLVEVPSGQHRGGGASSAWTAPLTSSSSSPSLSPTPMSSASSTIGQLGSRGGNRMYKVILPRNLTRRVLAPRPTNVQPQQQEQEPLQPLQHEAPAEFDNGVNDNNNSTNNNNNNNSSSKKDWDAKCYDTLRSRSDILSSTTSELPIVPTTIATPISPLATLADRSEATAAMKSSSSFINIQQSNQQRNQHQYHGSDIYNQNVFPPASPCCDEAEERLLRAMGWRREELAGEGPLTPEEITEATQWGHQISIGHFAVDPLQSRQQKQQQHQQQSNDDDLLREKQQNQSNSLQQLQCPLTERANSDINVIHKPGRDAATSTGRSAQLDHAARVGSDLKRALLATMGVLADSDSDLGDDNEDSDDDDDDDDG